MLELVLLGIVGPLALSVPLLALAWWRRHAGSREARRGWAASLALGGAPVLTYWTLEGPPSLPPVTGTQAWLGLVALTGALGAFDARRPLPATRCRLFVGVLAGATAWLMLRRLWIHGWGMQQGILEVSGAAAFLLMLVALLVPPASRSRDALTPLLSTWITATAAVVLAAEGSALLGQLAGALAAVLGACTVTAIVRPSFLLGRGAGATLGLGLGGLLLAGWHFAEVPTGPLLCVALSCAAPWLERWPPLAAGRRRTLALLLGTALPLGLALELVWAGFESSGY